MDNYIFCCGAMIWKVEEIPTLQTLVKAVLDITKVEFDRCIVNCDAEGLRSIVRKRTMGLSETEVNEVCNVLTKVGGEANGTT